MLHIDLETRSAADLKKVGAHRYAEDPSTRILLGSYRWNDEPVQRWRGETPPPEIVGHCLTGGRMVGQNQQFERVVLKARLGLNIKPETQDCTMARAAAVGLPHSLDNIGVALNLPIKKDKEGHALMLRMCKDGYVEKPGEMDRLAAYCDNDVVTECAADATLTPLSPRERQVWVLDQKINDRGFAVDLPLVQAAQAAVVEAQRRADDAMWRVTAGGVEKASQTARLAAWVQARGIPCTSVADTEIDELLIGADVLDDQAVTDALVLRRNSAGAFKFEAMLRAVCSDGRIRGSVQYHGTHGGRWAGRVVQPQNFKRVAEEDEAQVAVALDILRRFAGQPSKALDAMEMMLDMPPLEALSLCARPMILARPGHKLVDADFSNIEGRFNAWFAGEAWKLDAFAAYDRGEGLDLYKVTAGRVLGKDAAEITKDERQDNGKVPELACGYQGGWRALLKQAAKIGLVLPRGRATGIVDDWRAANPRIVESWYELQQAAIDACRAPGMIVPCLGGKVRYLKPADQDFLWCMLPSGRVISYASPQVGWRTKYFDEDGQMVPVTKLKSLDDGAKAALEETRDYGVTFWGQKSGRWLKLDLYGGMQCAHVVSGTARDFLVDAMMFPVEAAGYPLVLTVHDEGLAEVPISFGGAEHFHNIIDKAARDCQWAEGLPVAISAWEDTRYVK